MGVPQVRDTTVVHTLGKRYRYFPNMNKYQTASNLAGDDVSSRKRLRKSVPRVSNNSASDDASTRRSLTQSARRVSNNSATNDASSKKSLAKSLRMSAPQVSRDLGQTRGRVSPLQDHRISKKRKRNQITRSRVGSERDTHDNDYEDEVMEVDEAEFIKKIGSMQMVGPSARKGTYKGSASAHQTSWGAGYGVRSANGYWSISSDDAHIDSGVGETGNVDEDMDSEGYTVEKDEHRNKHIDASQHENLGIASRTQSRTTTRMKKSPETNDVISISSSSYDHGYHCSGDGDGFEVMSSHRSDSVECLSLYPEEDNGVEKTHTSSQETGGDHSKRDENYVEHVQQPLHEEQCHEAVDDAIVEHGHQVQSSAEDVFRKHIVPLWDSQCSRASINVHQHLNEEEEVEHNETVDSAIVEREDQVQSNEDACGKSLRSRAPNNVQELVIEEYNDSVDNATSEQGHRVQSNEDAFGEQAVPLRKSRGSRASKKADKRIKVPGEKKRSPTAVSGATGEKHASCLEGVTRLHDESQSQMRRLTEAVASECKKFNCNEDTDVHREFGTASLCNDEDRNSERILVAETKMKMKKKLTSARDIYRLFADAILKEGPRVEDVEVEYNDEDNNQVETPATDTQKTTLPLKFRFEDEIPEVVEETEDEKERKRLFTEFNLAFQMSMPQVSQTPNVNPEHECSVAEETHEVRCAREQHEYTTKDDEGRVCIYCSSVGLDPKDILPEWGKSTRRRPERKRPPCYLEDLPELEEEEVPLKSLMKRDASFNISDDGTVWDIKPGVRERMYKHQQEGFEFLWQNLAGSINLAELKSSQPPQGGGCIISHAPGTGKTRLTIIFLETYLKMFPRCQPLIIAPSGMLLTWQEEFRKWNFPFPFYDLKTPKFSGKESMFVLRKVTGRMKTKDTIRIGKAYSWDDNVSVLGISYTLFEKLTSGNRNKNTGQKNLEEHDGSLMKILLEKPGLAILDEGHYPRNEQSNIWNCFLKLKTEKRVVLSGTPFQNNFNELFNTLSLVRPVVASMLEGEKTFAEIYTSKGKRKYKNKATQSAAAVAEVINHDILEKLKSAIRPFVNVHKGTILRDSLPGLREVVIVLKPPSLQKDLIQKLKGRMSIEYEHTVALISVHPYLLQRCNSAEIQRLGIDPISVEALKLSPNDGAKTRFIFELLRLAVAANEKVLIFSQFIHPLELILEQLRYLFNWDVDKQILVLNGDTGQMKRQWLINYYNDPLSEAKVMLASTKCCNEGISLVGASRVVLLDVVWNPSVERQAISRAYRIGQKNFVHTYHLMTSGTSEGHKYCCQAEKGRLSELVFSSTSDEQDKVKNQAVDFEDQILEHMVGHSNLTDMFVKIIDQPKEADLVHMLANC